MASAVALDPHYPLSGNAPSIVPADCQGQQIGWQVWCLFIVFFHAILLSAQDDTEQKLAPAQQWRPVALSEALDTLHQVISATVVLCWQIIFDCP